MSINFIPDPNNGLLPTLEYPSDYEKREFDFENVPQEWQTYIKEAYDAAKPSDDANLRRVTPNCKANDEPSVPFPFVRGGQRYKLKLALLDSAGREIKAEYSLAPRNIAESPDYWLEIQPRQWFLYSYDSKNSRDLAAIPLKIKIERLRANASPISGFKAEIDQATINEARSWGYNGLEACVQDLQNRIDEALKRAKQDKTDFELVVDAFYFQASENELKSLRTEYGNRLNESRQALEVKLTLTAYCDDANAKAQNSGKQVAAQPDDARKSGHGWGRKSKTSVPAPAPVAPGAAFVPPTTATFKICFMPQTRINGIIALDLGFSSSTAALWLPSSSADEFLPNSKAQLANYRENLIKFFNTASPFSQGDGNELAAWDSFCVNLAANLGVDENNMSGDAARHSIVERLKLCNVQNNAYGDFYNFLRIMENTFYAQKPMDAKNKDYLRLLRRRTSEIYRGALNVFSYKRHSVELPVFDGDNRLESEFQLTDDEFYPQGEMGAKVKEKRVERKVFEEGKFNFYRFPKRKLANIHLSAESRKVFQGALTTLYKKALSEFYNHISLRSNEFDDCAPKVIVLYPATLSGDARRELTQLAREMGGARVSSKYDESIAPLIFYLTKLMGNFDEIGPEAFKVKCRRAKYDESSKEWFHNMLIVDVGMGTTDVSLVRLKMTEQWPSVGKDLGGRVYKFEPMLLGSMGFEDVSGNTFTKEIYLSLKERIAEILRPGCFVGVENDEERQRIADKIVPTQFFGKTGLEREKLEERFSFLWNLAEQIKIYFSEKHASSDSGRSVPTEIRFSDVQERAYERLRELFSEGNDGQWNEDDLCFRNEDFVKAQNTIVVNIEKRARTLAVVALNQAYKNERKRVGTERPFENLSFDGVDSIVLSGRSSQLPEVERKFKRSVAEHCVSSDAGSRPFAHPFTEITFEPKYAKTATAVGAVLAERMFESAYANHVNTSIEYGLCNKDVDVDNLFFNVSANFSPNGQPPIFNLQDELYFCDFTRMPRRQSGYGMEIGQKFRGVPRRVNIARSIGEDATASAALNFATLDADNRIVQLRAVNAQANIAVQYEITYGLILYALLVKTNANGDYTVGYTDRLEGLSEPVVIPIPKEKKAFKKGTDGKINLVCDIVWSDQSNVMNPLFKAGVTIDRCFRTSYLDNEELKKLKYCYFDGKNSLSGRTRAGTIAFFLRSTAQGGGDDGLKSFKVEDLRIDEGVKAYIENNQNSPNPRYRLNMTLAVDENGESGALILFVGDDHPPYWETEDFSEWLKQENQEMVYREKINAPNTPTDANDPFNGTL
ncbi:MAG: hypothetical protein J6K20_07080 [Thermoguttaceae bacterium]|nr:hypothetical protein [Thermoguttaceae bacterium]